MSKLIRFSAVLLFGLFCSLRAQESPSHQALIIDLSGEVTVQRPERLSPEKATWGMQLHKGDRIESRKNSTASILFVNNTLISLGPSSSMTIEQRFPAHADEERGSLDVSSAIPEDRPLLSFRDTGEGEVALLAGLRSSDANDILLVSPRKSKIPNVRPLFQWSVAMPFERYVVSVYSDSGIVWTHKTKSLSVTFPAEERPLKGGRSYFWNVKGEQMFREYRSEDVEFTIDDAASVARIRGTVEEIRTLFKGDTASHSYKFIVASFYEQEGYLDEARGYFEDLQAAYQDAPRIHEILGNLYAKMGLKDLAIIEFQKALLVGPPN